MVKTWKSVKSERNGKKTATSANVFRVSRIVQILITFIIVYFTTGVGTLCTDNKCA